jgi:hypothetical protein
VAVVEGNALFAVFSGTRTAAWLADQIGTIPDQAWDVGDLVGNGSSGRRHVDAGLGLYFDESTAENPIDAVLRAMLDRVEPLEGLNTIRAEVDVRVQCWGTCDSTQGGVWISADVMHRLGKLGAEFLCTIYRAD